MFLDIVISILEVLELVCILVHCLLLFSLTRIWPSLKLALSRVLQSFDVSLLQTDNISSLKGTIFDVTLLNRSL